MKLCVVCKHFTIDGGHADYSDLTPGENATIFCGKYVPGIYHDLRELDTEKFRKVIRTAETCEHYEEAK